MGRTVPTFRQLIDEELARWQKFRRALRRDDQQAFDRLFARVRLYSQAATYQCRDNPAEAILFALALDQEKRLAALEALWGEFVSPPQSDSPQRHRVHREALPFTAETQRTQRKTEPSQG